MFHMKHLYTHPNNNIKHDKPLFHVKHYNLIALSHYIVIYQQKNTKTNNIIIKYHRRTAKILSKCTIYTQLTV